MYTIFLLLFRCVFFNLMLFSVPILLALFLLPLCLPHMTFLLPIFFIVSNFLCYTFSLSSTAGSLFAASFGGKQVKAFPGLFSPVLATVAVPLPQLLACSISWGPHLPSGESGSWSLQGPSVSLGERLLLQMASDQEAPLY